MVSVLMPVYNSAPYVGEAITSVLQQTYTNWELIAVDDGSTDGSERIVGSFDDPRIQLHLQRPNRGVSATLNHALSLAKGRYIARHDADDVSMPERLGRQVAFLEAHPPCGILGAFAETIHPDGKPLGRIVNPTDNARIQFALLFDSAFASSTVMFRRDLLALSGGFDESRLVWDDYDMWSRLARFCEAANLTEQLLKYRMLPGGLTGRTTNARDMVVEQRRRNIHHFLPDEDNGTIELIAHTGFRHSRTSIDGLRKVQRALHALIGRFTSDPDVRRDLLAKAHGRLMGFHLLPHSNIIFSAVDRLSKTILLALPTITRND